MHPHLQATFHAGMPLHACCSASPAWQDDTAACATTAVCHARLNCNVLPTAASVVRCTQASKTQFVNRVQQCYAVRAQVDSFLDISRSTFSRLTGG